VLRPALSRPKLRTVKIPRDTSTAASVVRLVQPTTSQFIGLSVHLCVQHYGRDAARRVGPSPAAETCLLSIIYYTTCCDKATKFMTRLWHAAMALHMRMLVKSWSLC